MCDMESCTICLDQLFPSFSPDIITRLQPCGHYYHSDCITLWTDKSNSCPTCRRDFEFVETINSSGKVLTTKRAQKKVIEHIEEFFEGNDEIIMDYNEEDDLERRINNMIARSNICILCDSRHGNVTPCNTCSSTFHLSCLGATNLSRWFCPMCDAEQVNFERPISVFRRSRNSAITNRVYNSFRSSLITNPVTVEVKENPEPMTVEEQQSWEIFERAKNDQENKEPTTTASSSDNISTSSSPTVRKFKQPSRRGIRRGAKSALKSSSAIPTSVPSSYSSKPLVKTIVDQMRETRTTERLQFPNIPVPKSETPLPLSPSHSFSSSPGSSPQPTISSLSTTPENETMPIASNKSNWKMVIPNNTSKSAQKSTSQEIRPRKS